MAVSSLISAIFGAAEAGLSLLQEREKNYEIKRATAFAQRLHNLKMEWYKEYNRDPKTRSDAVLDHLEFELRQYLVDFASLIRNADIQNK